MNTTNTTTGVTAPPTPRTAANVWQWISAAKTMLFIWTAASIVGGIMLAVHKVDHDGDGWGTQYEHPFIAHGIGIIATAIVLWVIVMAVLNAIEWKLGES